MKKLTKDTPWTNNWASHRAVDRNGLLYEFNVEPKYNPLNGNWCISSRDVLQSHDLISNGWEFTPEFQFRVKEVGEVKPAPVTPDYHTLPCGTKIPPEGVQAWVCGVLSPWSEAPKTIVANVNGKYVTVSSGGMLVYNEGYSLTDPNVKPEPKRRKITSKELYGKCLHIRVDASKDLCMMVIGFDNEIVYTRHSSLTIDGIDKHCKGYSDTPTSELKPFWVEES